MHHFARRREIIQEQLEKGRTQEEAEVGLTQ